MARICMLVTSELDRDPRVQKEAASAHGAGHEVTVVCRTYTGPAMPYRVRALKINRRETQLGKYFERLTTNIALVREAVQAKPHIIHANDLDTLPAGYVASRLTGARLIYDAHELWVSAGRGVGAKGQRLALHLERFISRRADAVIAVSRFRSQRMAQMLDIPEPTVVMNTPFYAAFDRLSPLPWSKQFTGKRIVLHQGRYVEHRGIPEAVLAAKNLPDNVVLVFRGYGPIESELRDLVVQHNLEDRVVFLPPVPMNELVAYAVGADLGLVLYTPYNDNNLYAAPNKMFEYMMAGVPSVSSDIPYAREVLLGDNVGAVFAPSNSEDMARVIMTLLDNPEQLQTMKANSIRSASKYCWENEFAKLLAEYEKTLQ
jgi:glycosyltransferase involved in cell wall biosynthesis